MNTTTFRRRILLIMIQLYAATALHENHIIFSSNDATRAAMFNNYTRLTVSPAWMDHRKKEKEHPRQCRFLSYSVAASCTSESRYHKYRGRSHKIPTGFRSFYPERISHIIFYASGYVETATPVARMYTRHAHLAVCPNGHGIHGASLLPWLNAANDITASTKIAMASIRELKFQSRFSFDLSILRFFYFFKKRGQET